MIRFPPTTLHLIGPVWETEQEARDAARIDSAAQGGLSIAIYSVPEGGYSLAWGEGRVIVGWEKAGEGSSGK